MSDRPDREPAGAGCLGISSADSAAGIAERDLARLPYRQRDNIQVSGQRAGSMKKLLPTVITLLLLSVGVTWADPSPRHGWLGVHIMPMTQQIADSLGLHDTTGSLVVGVTPNGPAEAARIIDGDIILQFNGQYMDESHALPLIVREAVIGSQVPVTLLRDGNVMIVTAKVGELPDDQQVASGRPIDDAKAAYRRGDYATALQIYRSLAVGGDPVGQWALAVMYAHGLGATQDYAEAAKWSRLSAAQGNGYAQYGLGWMYAYGRGVPRDYAEAAKWIRLAAEQGFRNAQYRLGVMYEHGQGVPQDDAAAVKWFRLAAAQEYARAQASLGFMFATGRGVTQSYAVAAEWDRLAAAQGVARAQSALGWMYDNGKGVEQDYSEAVKWYRLAVAQGDGYAQAGLATMYANGLGVPEDLEEAQRLLQLAADQNVKGAAEYLAKVRSQLPR